MIELGLIALAALMYSELAAIRRRQSWTLKKIDRLLDASGVDQDELLSPELRTAMASGRRLKAIKRYREETGAWLTEAKVFIDRYGMFRECE